MKEKLFGGTVAEHAWAECLWGRALWPMSLGRYHQNVAWAKDIEPKATVNFQDVLLQMSKNLEGLLTLVTFPFSIFVVTKQMLTKIFVARK